MFIDPFDLERGTGRSTPIGPWDKGQDYPIAFYRPTNLEMTAIFDADQADRTAGDQGRVDWPAVGATDLRRRKRTQELLDAGKLNSGEDFYHAAFVFQHGSSADDYLKAHALATIAVARGKAGGVWIAAASLDRYLQAIGKPQVFGTQFSAHQTAPVTQEPYDRTIISDAMRKALHVPPLAGQKEQMLIFQNQVNATTKPAN